jgi:hypothetical protein
VHDRAGRCTRRKSVPDTYRMTLVVRPLRIGLVLLLLGGAYWAAQPWLDCAGTLLPTGADWVRLCTIGTGIPSFQVGGFYINLLLGVLYLASAMWLAFTRRASDLM